MVFILPRPKAPAGDSDIRAGMKELGLWQSRLNLMYPDLHHHYWLSLFVVICVHCIISVVTLHQIFLLQYALDSQNMQIAIEKAFIAFDLVFYNFSYFNLHRKRNSLDSLLKIIGSKFFTYKYPWKAEDRKKFREDRKSFKKFRSRLSKFIYISSMFHGLLIPLIKVCESGRYSTIEENRPINSNLAIGSAQFLPVDGSRLGGFIVGYLYEAGFTLFIASIIVNTDAVLIDLVDLLRRQIQILVRSVGKIPRRALEMYKGNEKRKHIESEEYQECLYKAFTESIQHHVVLLRYSKDLQKVMSSWLLLLFVGSGITICTGGYLVKNMKTIGAVVFLNALLYLSITFLIIYLYCWFSEQLENASLEYNKALYNTHWYKYSPKFRRALYLSLMFNQNMDFKLKIISTNFSLRTFGDVLKTSYSYLNVLTAKGS